MIVPRYSHSAVDRNTVKRRLRTLGRTELLPTMGAIDVVIRANPAAYAASFDELRAALHQAMKKLPKTGMQANTEAAQ